MIPAGPGDSRETSDPGDGLGLLPCRMLRGFKVARCHVNAEDTLAAVADQVERLRPDDLAGNGLPMPTALACNNGSHLYSPRPVRQFGPPGCELATGPPGPRVFHGFATPSLQRR
jgi:hypothetical protein